MSSVIEPVALIPAAINEYFEDDKNSHQLEAKDEGGEASND